jgi:para-aminobenzoate synthetase component I
MHFSAPPIRHFLSFELPSEFGNPAAAVHWASTKNTHMVFLSSSGLPPDDYSQIDAIMATGIVKDVCPTENQDAFSELKNLTDQTRDWIFGFLSYDLKNQTEELKSENHDGIKMPLMHFFVPEVVYIFSNGKIEIGVAKGVDKNHRQLFDEMISFQPSLYHREKLQ